jgi:hypothetical protein
MGLLFCLDAYPGDCSGQYVNTLIHCVCNKANTMIID